MKAEKLQTTMPGSELTSTAKSGSECEIANLPDSQPVLSAEDSQTSL